MAIRRGCRRGVARRARTCGSPPPDPVRRLTLRPWWPAAALAAGTPLIVDVGGHNRYVAARAVFLTLALAAALVAGRRGLVVDRGIARSWAALLAVTALATAFGVDPLLSLLGDPVRLMGLLGVGLGFVAFVAGAEAGGSGLRAIVGATLVGATVVVLFGLVEWLTGDHRPESALGNAGFLGAYLCLVLPLALSAALSDRLWRDPAAVLTVAAAALVVATGTRGAWLGAGAGVVVVVLLRWRRVGLVLVAVGTVALAAALVPTGGRTTAQGRVDTWRETVDVVADRPVLGWGPESFRTGFARHVGADWVRQYSLEQIPDRAHNRWLDAAASTGALGVAADLALLVAAGLALRRALRAEVFGSPRWWAVAGVTGAAAGYLVQSLFLFETFDLRVVAWLLVGAATGLAGAPEVRNVPSRLVVRVAALTTVVVALAAVNVVADRRVARNKRTADAATVARLGDAVALRPRSLDASLLLAQAARFSQDPGALRIAHERLRGWDDPYARLADASVLSTLAARKKVTFDRAIVTYQAGLRAAPTNGRGWLGLAHAYRLSHFIPAARDAFERADYLLPNDPGPRIGLALLAFDSGRFHEGCEHAREARRRDPTLDLPPTLTCPP